MTVEYEFTLADAVAFSLYHHAHSRAGKRARWIARLIVPFLILVMLMVSDTGEDPVGRAVLFWFTALVIFLWVLMAPTFVRIGVRRATERACREGNNELLFGVGQLSLEPAGIKHTTHLSSSEVAWEGLEQIASTPDHLFLYVSAFTALVVPRRAFADEAAFRAFADKAKELWNGAHGVTA